MRAHDLAKSLVVEGMGGDAVATGHRLGGEQGVRDRLLGRLGDGLAGKDGGDRHGRCRIAGKSEDIQSQLNRIPAQNVVRIEILDGATLEIPGLSGQVANVIFEASDLSGQLASTMSAHPMLGLRS